MTIRLEVAGGVIEVLGGAEEVFPPRSCELWVAGGRLILDMRHLDAMPSALIDDPGQALMWLPHVFGDEINDAVLNLLDDAAGTGVAGKEIDDDAWVPGDLIDDVRRTMVAEWMARWWPSHTGAVPRLDDALLGLEAAALKWRCPLLFDREQTADELEPLVPFLARLMGAPLAGDSAHEGRLAEVVWDAADAVCHLLDLDTPAFDAVADGHERHLLGDDQPADDIEDLLAGLPGPEEPLPADDGMELALAASLEDETGITRLTVDPLQVRPRSVGGDAGNVEVVTADGVMQIVVRPGDAPADSLWARIWSTEPGLNQGRSFPLARESWGYVAEIELSGLYAHLDPGSVDIVDSQLLSKARSQQDALSDRDFIVGLLTRRITGDAGSGGADTSAVAPFLVENGAGRHD